MKKKISKSSKRLILFIFAVIAIVVVYFIIDRMIILNKYEKYERFCVKNSDCHWVPGCCMKAYPVNIYHDVESSIVCLIVCPANATFTIPQDKILKCINNQCSSI